MPSTGIPSHTGCTCGHAADEHSRTTGCMSLRPNSPLTCPCAAFEACA